MRQKFALNFICKNESKVILNMLNSAKSITDLIVAVDTGSTDNTKELIIYFGKKNNIPTYIFDHPFDDFSKSRNYALDSLKKVVADLGWNSKEVWAFWIDCDETMILKDSFDKKSICKDIYYVTAFENEISFFKSLFFNISKEFRWYGPIHETIICPESDISHDTVDGIKIKWEKKGNSWQGDITLKYLNYAKLLISFIAENNKSIRWIYYLGECYNCAAIGSSSENLKWEYFSEAKKYFEMVLESNLLNCEELYVSQLRIAEIMRHLDEPWDNVECALLKAYKLDPIKGDSFKEIIEYYMQNGLWSKAYQYAHFAYKTYHNKSPLGRRVMMINDSLYRWRFNLYYFLSCYYSGRREDAYQIYVDLWDLVRRQRGSFTNEEIKIIRSNSPFVLPVVGLVKAFRRSFRRIF